MKKAISDITTSKSGRQKVGSISLEGELTLNHITALKKEMMDALETCDSLKLKIQNVTSVDLSWIQLLQSIRKTCRDSGKNVAIEMILNSDAELLLARTGFSSLLESTKSNNQTI
jgi:ABC-type transporter Mla MlaB component